MLSRLTERKIGQLFYIIGTREQEIEKSREILNQNFDFETYTSFKHLDLEVRGSISAYDIQEFLSRHHKFLDVSYIHLLISQYDLNLDGRLSLNEYSKLVLSQTNEMLRDSVTLRTPLPRVSLEVEYLLLHLLELEIILHEEIEKVRCDITIQTDFSLLDSFRMLDYSKSSNLDKSDLRALLSRHGFYLSEAELLGVFRRLDHDSDGVLNYIEYVDAVMPKKTRIRSPAKRFSPSKNFVTEKNIHTYESPFRQIRHSSPLRSSPLRNSPSKVEFLVRKNSPLRNSPSRVEFLVRKNSPLRNSPTRVEFSVRKSSPLKKSPPRTTFLQGSPSRLEFYARIPDSNSRKSSPLRQSPSLRQSPPKTLSTNLISFGSPVRQSPSLRESPAKFLTTNLNPSITTNIYSKNDRNTPLRSSIKDSASKSIRISPSRHSSPLRQSPSRYQSITATNFSPSKSHVRFSPLRSADIGSKGGSPLRNSSEPFSFPVTSESFGQKTSSPLKSIPLRNVSLRDGASYADQSYASIRNSASDNKYSQSLRNSNL